MTNNWQGKQHGIRRPDVDETPLSSEEVSIAAKIGLIPFFEPDKSPIIQRRIPAGQWVGHARDDSPLHFFKKNPSGAFDRRGENTQESLAHGNHEAGLCYR